MVVGITLSTKGTITSHLCSTPLSTKGTITSHLCSTPLSTKGTMLNKDER
jgi:hypothetical protein